MIIGPFHTHDIQAALDMLYVCEGVVYEVVKQEAEGEWTVIWVEVCDKP